MLIGDKTPDNLGGTSEQQASNRRMTLFQRQCSFEICPIHLNILAVVVVGGGILARAEKTSLKGAQEMTSFSSAIVGPAKRSIQEGRKNRKEKSARGFSFARAGNGGGGGYTGKCHHMQGHSLH